MRPAIRTGSDGRRRRLPSCCRPGSAGRRAGAVGRIERVREVSVPRSFNTTVRPVVASVAGLTHAMSVIPLVRSSEDGIGDRHAVVRAVERKRGAAPACRDPAWTRKRAGIARAGNVSGRGAAAFVEVVGGDEAVRDFEALALLRDTFCRRFGAAPCDETEQESD